MNHGDTENTEVFLKFSVLSVVIFNADVGNARLKAPAGSWLHRRR
jgi:hypothetical protein